MVDRFRGSDATTADSDRRLLWHGITVHFGKEARDGVRPDCHVDCGQQFADEPQRAPFRRSSTIPSLNGNSLAWRVGDGSVNVRAASLKRCARVVMSTASSIGSEAG